MEDLLEIKDLELTFDTEKGRVFALNGVNLEVRRGETLCVVGESGCGKSVTSMSIMRLLNTPPAHYQGGQILFEGKNLLQKNEKEMCAIRGKEIAMIFQEPMTSLNPVYTIGRQITETILLHEHQTNQAEAFKRAVELLSLVGISDPKRRMKDYPHQLSGGLRQRVMIAIALSCHPKLLIADEPTTALDVTIQAQILRLLKRLKKELNMTILLITHDMGVVAQMAGQVAVMYGGNVIEQAETMEFFKNPQHPYTRDLLNCIPRMDQPRGRLYTIEGSVSVLRERAEGCVFQNRCKQCGGKCATTVPEMRWQGTHGVSCLLAGEGV